MMVRSYSTAFVGRKDELALLWNALGAAVDGQPGALLIGGEAGVGKTRLVSEFARQALEAGMRVLTGGCVQLSGGSGLPYGPMVEAIRGLRRELTPEALGELLGPDHAELGRLLPSGAGYERLQDARIGVAIQARLFELWLRLLGRLGEAAPVVLVVEDVQWADRSTLDLLMFLLRNLRYERLLILATYRDDEPQGQPQSTILAELSRIVAGRIDLPRFGRDEVAELLTAVIGRSPASGFLDRVLASSGGNAFLVEELATAGLEEQTVRLTPKLHDILMARFEVLSPEAQEALRALAAIGRRVDHRLLAAVHQPRDERELLRALREAVAQRILVVDADGLYVFRHALVREVVYDDLIGGERLRLHAAVARALADDPSLGPQGASGAVELAFHLDLAQDLPRALAAMVEAARRSAASVYAFAEADRLYARALELWDRVPSPEVAAGLALTELLEEAAEAARWVGDIERAIALADRALATTDPDESSARAGRLEERLGLYRWEAGDGASSLAAYEEASRLLEGEEPSADRAWVLAAHGTALMLSSRYGESRARCEEAVAMAQSLGARGAAAHALNSLGFDLVMLGEPEAGIACLHRAREIVEADRDIDGICRVYTNLPTLLFLTGRLEEAMTWADRGMERMRQLGIELTGGGVLLGIEAVVLFRLGRWQEADLLIRATLQRGVPQGLAVFAHTTKVELETGRGLLDEADASLQLARGVALRVTDPMALGALQASAAELAIWEGDHRAAREAVALGLQALAAGQEDHLVLRLCALGLRAEADQAERVTARRSAAELREIERQGGRLLTRARALAGQAGSSAAIVEAAMHATACEAEYARLRRQSDADRWDAVAGGWEALGVPYPAAYARWRQAEALLGGKARNAATKALRAALDLTARVDLEPAALRREIERLARRAHLDLRESVAPAAEPKPVPPPGASYGLTPRECEVLELLSRGWKNGQIARALFITEKTASVHVSNIMAKLNVESRGEAAAMAYRLKLVDDAVPDR